MRTGQKFKLKGAEMRILPAKEPYARDGRMCMILDGMYVDKYTGYPFLTDEIVFITSGVIKRALKRKAKL